MNHPPVPGASRHLIEQEMSTMLPPPPAAHPSRRRRRAAALATVLTLTGASLAIPAPATAAPDVPANPAPGQTAAQPTPLAGVAPGEHEITLLTGDTVLLTVAADGRYQATIGEPAPRPDGSPVESFESTSEPDGVYVVPSDAQPAIESGLLDRELFNITYLAEHGYTDAESDHLPMIVTYREPVGRASERSAAPDDADLARHAEQLPGVTDAVGLSSINGGGAGLAKDRAGQFWQQLRGAQPDPAQDVRQVWLDRVVEVDLDASVPLVGAPQAWGAGYDGTGTTVAVLDTGIDETHPDLAGQVVDSKSFVPGVDSVKDGHGHGTHVAATVAGTGAASDGVRKGVAPGADLVIGKVLSDGGSGSTSGIIDGMEWAAEDAGADVVSMSLGSGPTDGTDPASQAVNRLTASTGTLFVIAAGNDGPGSQTISAPGAADAALTVAATDKQDQLADFSSRGPRLDGALKPDIAAPGVAIVAARAAGTALGSPVSELYTAASGTSMATPHVAGAAAILAQQHPDWRAAQLKSTLMSTASDAGYSVYEQGAGRLDVARAVGQVEVFAATPHLDFGLINEDQVEPVSQQVTYVNESDQPVTLTLAPKLVDLDGSPAAGGALTADQTVTVPAGGTAAATVTLDPTLLVATGYSGALTATSAQTGVHLVTPVAVDKRLVLTVHTLDRNGEPAPPLNGSTSGGAYPIWVLPVDLSGTGNAGATAAAVRPLRAADLAGSSGGAGPSEDGTTRVLVRAGTYHLQQKLWWADNDVQKWAELVDPLVEVTGNTEITLDARQAVEVSFTTPQDTVPFGFGRHVERSLADGTLFVGAELAIAPTSFQWRIFVTPTEPVTTGVFRYSIKRELSNPQLTMHVRSPQPVDLHPYYRAWDDRGESFGYVNVCAGCEDWVPFTGEQALELVDVGFARPEDVAGLDLDGKLALFQRGEVRPGDDVPYSGIWIDRIKHLEDAGAVGYLAFSNPPPGYEDHMSFTAPNWSYGTPSGGGPKVINLPEAQISRSEGHQLQEMLSHGPVTIDVAGDPNIHYTYQLQPWEEQQIPDSLDYSFSHRDLARIGVHHHLSDADQEIGLARGNRVWYAHKPGTSFIFSKGAVSAAPRVLPEYVGPLSSDTVWTGDQFYSGAGTSVQTLVHLPPRVFDEPGRADQHLNVVPFAPGAVSLDAWLAAHPATTFGYEVCSMCREGDTFVPFYFPTAGDGQFLSRGTLSLNTSLFKENGEQIPLTPLTVGILPGFRLPGEPEVYRLVHNDPLRNVDTTWTYASSRPETGSAAPGYICSSLLVGIESPGPCRPESLIFLNYDLSGSLQLDNTVPVPGWQRFAVTAYNGQSTQPAPQVTGLRLWTSTDGGQTWDEARVVPDGRGDGSGRSFHVIATYPRLDQASGTAVSLRAEAWDAAGNRVEQVIESAFELTDRAPADLR
ncbi:MAG: S8 family serine peptidase [Micromonosporaceae bacterium]|nr:S8 family serine peptidase [Micromonosporaceae bacterium]